MTMSTVRVSEAGRGRPGANRPRPYGPRVRWLVVALTSVGIAVYFPGQYYLASLKTAAANGTGLASTYAGDPPIIRAVFYAHITFAGLALFLGPLQFIRAIRARTIGVHRWIGRTFVFSVAVGSVAAFTMSFVSSAALLGFFGFGSLAVLWGFATYRGYTAVRHGDIASHQAWMIRSFALTYAAVMLRLWLIVFLIGLHAFAHGRFTDDQIFDYAYAPVPFLCWLPNIVVAEMLIRRRNLPGLRFATPTGATPAEQAL